ncbi:hypothetical protein GCM10009696_32750 [Kocuria himachalensis]
MNTSETRSHTRRLRLSAAALCVGALILPAAAITPAEAAVTHYGCTMSAKTPKDSTKGIDYRQTITISAHVTCKKDTKVQVAFQAYENDGPPNAKNDRIGGWRLSPADNANPNWKWVRKDTSTVFEVTLRTVDWDDDNIGDFFHRPKFRIVLNDEYWSTWSKEAESPILRLPWDG